MDRYLTGVKPLIWWGRDKRLDKEGNINDEYGEIPIIGEEKSLFETLLPKTGELENLHPVTALWMLHILEKSNKIKVLKDFELFKDLESNKVIYYSWCCSKENSVVGDVVNAVVVGEKYNNISEAKLYGIHLATNKELFIEDIELDENGVSVHQIAIEFWGDCELKIRDDDQATNEESATTILKIKKPVIDYDQCESVDTGKYDTFKLKLVFKENCPLILKGLFYFQFRKEGEESWQDFDKAISSQGLKEKDQNSIQFNIDGDKAFYLIKEKIKDSLSANDKVELGYIFYSLCDGIKEDYDKTYNQGIVDIKLEDIKKADYLVYPQQGDETVYITISKKITNIQFIEPIEFTISGNNIKATANYTEGMKQAKPYFECNKRGLKSLSRGDTSMSVLLPAYLHPNTKIKFSTKITRTSQLTEVKMLEEEYDSTIRLIDFEVDIVQDENNNEAIYFRFQGVAKTMPTQKILQIKYKKENEDWENATVVKNQCYTNPYKRMDHGCCDERGNFGALIPIDKELEKYLKEGGKLIFRWAREWDNGFIFKNIKVNPVEKSFPE